MEAPMATHRRNPEPRALERALERAETYLKGAAGSKPQYIFERPDINAREIREALGMSRQEFAMEFGISLRTLENWEDGRRQPDGPARTLLIAIAYEPDAVRRAILRYRGLEVPAARRATSTALRRPLPGAR